MDILLALLLTILFIGVLTGLFFFSKKFWLWLKRNWKKFIAVFTTGCLVSGGIVLMRLDDPPPPVGDEQRDSELYIWNPGHGYGSMPRWEVNKTYVKEFLKEHFWWRLQASVDNVSWTNTPQFLDIGLGWNDELCGYKVNLTLNTTGAPKALYYRFILGVNKTLKDYVETDGWEWTLTVPGNDTKDVLVFFNWSDIQSLVETGKVWFDKGVTDNKFWFGIQTVSKIQPDKVFVVDPTYGVIPAAVTDSFEWNTLEGRTYGQNAVVRVNNSEYYLIVEAGDSGTDYDGWARTIQVWNDNGTIMRTEAANTVVSSYEFDISDGYEAVVAHIPGTDKYVVAYDDVGSTKLTLVVLQVWDNNGTINQGVIDSQQCLTYSASTTEGGVCLFGFTDNVYVVAYSDYASTDGWMETWWIDYTGMINDTMLDSEEFDATYGRNPTVCGVDSDTVLLSYIASSSGGDLKFMTYNITTSGLITDTPADSWAYEASPQYFSGCQPLKKIGDSTYLVSYCDGSYDIYVKTFTVSDSGMITEAFIDTLLVFNGDVTNGGVISVFYVNDPSVSSSGNGVMGVTLRQDYTNFLGWVYTFNVSSAGVLGDDVVDSLQFSSADVGYSPVIWVNQSLYLVVYTGGGNDGWSATVMIETNWASPTVGNPSPVNGSTGETLTPLCSADVADLNGDTMIVDFYTSTDGSSWTWRQTNGSAADGTYYYNYAGASSYSTTYYWRVTCSDDIVNVSSDYHFETMANPNANPTFAGESPTNQSTNTGFTPQCYVVCNDADGGDTLTVDFYDNTSGSLVWRSGNTSVNPGENHSFNFAKATSYSTKYWWTVWINDGTINVSDTYAFTTHANNIPSFSNEVPTNGTTDTDFTPTVYLVVTDTDNTTTCDFYTSPDGSSWTWRQTNTSIVTGTNISYVYSGATTINTKYYWKVTAYDGTINITSGFYDFTTQTTNTGSFYVSNDGNDLNSGSEKYPWETITKVNTELNGGVIGVGDDIFFNRGDTWTGSTYLQVRVGGASDNWMTIGAYGTGDKPYFYNMSLAGYPAINIAIAENDYIKIENLSFFNVTQANMVAVRAVNNHSYITFDNLKITTYSGSTGGGGIFVNQTYYPVIQNCYFENLANSAIVFYGSFTKMISYGKIFNCTSIRCASNENRDNGVIHVGDIAGEYIGSYFLIENSTFSSGYEQSFDVVNGTEVIFKNCTFSDAAASTASGNPIWESESLTFINCIFRNETGNGMLTGNVNRITAHNCIFYNTPYSEIEITDNTRNLTIYNSDFIFGPNGSLTPNGWVVDIANYTNTQNLMFKNNIFYSPYEVNPANKWVRYNGLTTTTNTNSMWINNMWGRGITGLDGTDFRWWLYNAAYQTWSSWENLTETMGELRDNPELADIDGFDFTLNSTSPCIDTGAQLTFTVGGGTGTTFTVDSARYFYDGYSMTDGDTIVVGNNVNLLVTDVNYITNVITVDRSITWLDGAYVSLMYNGGAPDIGAYEYLSANSVPTFSDETPTNNSVFSGITPDCYVVCNDVDIADTLTIDFYENTTGGYVWVSGNTGVDPNTNISFNYVNADEYETTYYWMVTSYDGTVNSSVIYHFTTETLEIWTDTYRLYGEDYIVWLGESKTAVDINTTFFENITWQPTDYFAIWNETGTWNTNWYVSGLWYRYYPYNSSGDDFIVHTFDTIRTNITMSTTGNQTMNMTGDSTFNYTNTKAITLTNGTQNKGYNYTGYNRMTPTTLSAVNTSIGLTSLEWISVWNRTSFDWDVWISGWSSVDYPVNQWDVCETKVTTTRTWDT